MVRQLPNVATWASLSGHQAVTGDLTDARILIIDDSRTSRMIAEKCLREAGFTALAFAADGIDGYDTACSYQPELIITDLVMPNMDGFELCRKLRADAQFGSVPIIAQTGLGDAEGRAAIFGCGATDLVAKPINALEFISRVKIHLEHRRMFERLSDFNERIAHELDMARQMQSSLMPTDAEIADIRARVPLDLSSLYEPSNELGGDIWGLDDLGDGRVRLYSADFAGHGVVSSFNTFRLHTFLSTGATKAAAPAAWLAEVNNFLCEVLPRGQFATMFCAVIDFPAARITCASAAAPPVFLSQGSAWSAIDLSGLPLGILPDTNYDDVTLDFPRGSTLFVYSDALIETPNPDQPVLSFQGLGEALNALKVSETVETIRKAILARLFTHITGGLADDLTMVVLRHEERVP